MRGVEAVKIIEGFEFVFYLFPFLYNLHIDELSALLHELREE